METLIEQTKAEFIRAQQRITVALAATPDDKINWSPSPTARTPIHEVAHAAMSTTGILGMLTGKPFPYAGMAEMDAASRAAEKEFTSRDQVLALLDQSSAEYLSWLDGLTDEQIGSTIQMPFGQMPLASAMTLAADHLRGHASQVEYIQTIYGDLVWHM